MSRSTNEPSVIWVAGVGASAGLGAAIARRFAREGFVAALSGRTEARLERVAAEIRAAGGEAVAVPADVREERDIDATATRVAALGELAVAVYNAGGARRAPALELTAADFEEAWRATALGGFLFAKAALRLQVPRARGTLLLTGATASLRGKPPFAAFAAAKASLRSLGQSLAREFGPRGIHVAHVVIDGGIDGERLRSQSPDRDAEGLLKLDDIAEAYYQLHAQRPSAWTQELDLRPYKEPF